MGTLKNKEIKKIALKKLGNDIRSDNFVYFAFAIRVACVVVSFCALLVSYFQYKQMLTNRINPILPILFLIVNLQIPFIPFDYSLDRKMLQVSESNADNNYDFDDLTYYYNNNSFSVIGLSLLQYLYLQLWLFTIIGPFIKVFSYSMSRYIKIEHPQWGANECITESRRVMDGYKFKLFCLYISFIGWYLLAILTLGAIYPFVKAYMEMSLVEFYNSIKNENKEIEHDANEEIEDIEVKPVYNAVLQNKMILFILTLFLSMASFIGFNYWSNKMQRDYYKKVVDVKIVDHNPIIDNFVAIDIRKNNEEWSKQITLRLY